MKNPEAPTAWAWEFEAVEKKWWLCRWAEPDKYSLGSRPKPSTEARAVRVRIIRESDYRKLLKAAKENP